jgi:hypothetical protein
LKLSAQTSLGKFTLLAAPFKTPAFAGIADTTADIRAVVHDSSNYFAFGPISLLESVPAGVPARAPEPSAFALAAVGILVVTIFGRPALFRR